MLVVSAFVIFNRTLCVCFVFLLTVCLDVLVVLAFVVFNWTLMCTMCTAHVCVSVFCKLFV